MKNITDFINESAWKSYKGNFTADDAEHVKKLTKWNIKDVYKALDAFDDAFGNLVVPGEFDMDGDTLTLNNPAGGLYAYDKFNEEWAMK